ncbi:MAG: orotidine-5'-phosphate decarboxylase [Gemmatimonadota bacterium]|jgi:orotidine-5'-phosphate decarboxylase
MAGVIIPLDVPTRELALGLVDTLGDRVDFYKVGLELYTAEGPAMVSTLRDRGKRVFLDLKLHDIPSTVAGAVRTAAVSGADLLTVHATGGRAMMEAAVEAAREAADGGSAIRLLAVTILTSSSAADVESAWGRTIHSLREEVVRLATLGAEAGVHGAVASALEAATLRRQLGPDFLLVTPGIRLEGGDRHDQARVATPDAAVEAGSDYLVVGRAVTAAPDPVAALGELHARMAEGGA